MSADRRDVLYGTLGLLVLKTLEAIGPLHGYPAFLKLEQAGWAPAAGIVGRFLKIREEAP